MIALIFYCFIIYGFVVAIQPIINIILLFIRDTWDKYIEWDKKRIKTWMDAYHRGTPGGNYEYYDPDKSIEEEDIPHIWNEELIKADYDKYDDPFYIQEDKD